MGSKSCLLQRQRDREFVVAGRSLPVLDLARCPTLGKRCEPSMENCQHVVGEVLSYKRLGQSLLLLVRLRFFVLADFCGRSSSIFFAKRCCFFFIFLLSCPRANFCSFWFLIN